MLGLTQQERQVVVFLAAVALAGLGINISQKLIPPVKKFVCAESNSVKININQASLEDILRTRAVPKKIAGEIIAFRDNNGPYIYLEQLKKIKGIKEARFNKLKEFFFAE
ncbi:MAG: helix-hairpin-helix domain-containing protein [Candidatus Omnitrophica bacterium]|nr:helix-hairpin-helix domain-containing protein [Candidatus Omnitrophota bacterium]